MTSPAVERAALTDELADIAEDTGAEAARAAVLARLKADAVGRTTPQ